MNIYNSLTRKIDSLPSPGVGPIRLFVCGPTVYDYIHIGNARTYAAFDSFVKYLRSQGFTVKYLQNITDIDDKIIARGLSEGTNPAEVAQRFSMAFREDAAKLSITSPDTYAPATEHIPQIIRQIERLIEKKCAYQIEQDGWYFDLSAFPDYGKLAGRTVEQAEDGVSRIDSSDSKRNRGDFCIWKFSKAGEPSWGAPFGAGRPGWHIEDTAITEDYFGPQYEIHGGGRDLIFPHHEAEIAQQESASGKKPFVQYWMHAGLVTVEGKKMSKSLGNFVTVRDFLTRHSPNLFRFFVAQHHYRAPLDYSEAAVAAASSALASITEFWLKARFAAEKSQKSTDAIDLREFDREFNEAMNDDCNTPLALASLFKLANASGKRLWYISGTNASEIGAWLEAKLAIFGVILTAPALPESIAKLMGEREAFRSHQQFIQADRLRKEIEDLGYRVDDTPAGSLFLGPR